jgi:L-ascorbate metabolism protein UlaG (beta-lactamase superfamily)
MRLVKYTHACVRIEQDDRTLVIDPGVWTEAEAFDGVSNVLITHEHFDHLDADRLAAALDANPALKVYTNADVVLIQQMEKLGDAVVAVNPGDEFTAAGFRVRVVGGRHAEIYEGLPGCANIGFVVSDDSIDGGLYHPGDALFVPDVPIDTLFVPTSAPWLKLAEALDFIRAVTPRRTFSIHDAMLGPLGLQSVDRWLTLKGNTEYARLPIGESVTLTA